jgi:hypothetical protein
MLGWAIAAAESASSGSPPDLVTEATAQALDARIIPPLGELHTRLHLLPSQVRGRFPPFVAAWCTTSKLQLFAPIYCYNMCNKL